MQYMQVVCIGYGKIGYGICTKLRELGIRPKVLEKDSMRTIQAVRDGCDILLEKDFKNIDLIFVRPVQKSRYFRFSLYQRWNLPSLCNI